MQLIQFGYQIYAIILSIVIIIIAIYYFRTNRLGNIGFSFWILLGIGMCALGIYPDAINILMDILGSSERINTFFMLAIGGWILLSIALHLSLNALRKKITELIRIQAQNKYLIEYELKKSENSGSKNTDTE